MREIFFLFAIVCFGVSCLQCNAKPSADRVLVYIIFMIFGIIFILLGW